MEKHENPKNQAGLIWNVADILRGGWKQHEYQDVILPLVVLKRLDSVLAKTKQNVLQTYHQMHGTMSDDSLSLFLEKEAGYKFYNTSPYDFKKLLDDSEGIYANFINYLDGFSPNVRDIVTKFEFQKQLNKLKSGKILHLILQELDKVDLSPEAVSNHDMGYIFEELIRRFSEQSNETAGEHYTPREVIRLMVRLLLQPDADRIKGESKIIEMYDPACGTGGMLTIGKEYIQDKINPDAEVYLYGQELNPQTYAIAKSDILIKGEDANRIKGGSGEHAEDSTLSNDQFYNKTFDYVIANPPYGIDWKKDKEAVETEAARGDAGRFPAGTPDVSDGQMLFLQHMVSKLRPKHEGGGRVAVVLNGSALFSGGAGRGPSNIRKWLITNDYIEAVISLPSHMFYNTDITTYVLVLSNRKPDDRKDKIQLINASGYYHKLKKNLGKKNREMSDSDISKVYDLYSKFSNSADSRIVDASDFGYHIVTIEQPKTDSHGRIVLDSKSRPIADPEKRNTLRIGFNDDLQEYFSQNVKPHFPEAWVNEKRTKEGYEIPFNEFFYSYSEPRKVNDIDDDLGNQSARMSGLLDTLRKELELTKAQQREKVRHNLYKSVMIGKNVDIPHHWDIVPLSALFVRKKVTNYPEEELLSVYRDYGVIPKKSRDDNRNEAASDLSNYQLVEEGDIVINKMKAWQGSIAISHYRGIVSPAYFIFKPIKKHINRDYIHYLLRSSRYISVYKSISKGIRPGQWDLDEEKFKKIIVPLPPESEQAEIVKAIKLNEARAEDLISVGNAQLDLIGEKKDALISDVIFGLGNDK